MSLDFPSWLPQPSTHLLKLIISPTVTRASTLITIFPSCWLEMVFYMLIHTHILQFWSVSFWRTLQAGRNWFRYKVARCWSACLPFFPIIRFWILACSFWILFGCAGLLPSAFHPWPPLYLVSFLYLDIWNKITEMYELRLQWLMIWERDCVGIEPMAAWSVALVRIVWTVTNVVKRLCFGLVYATKTPKEKIMLWI